MEECSHLGLILAEDGLQVQGGGVGVQNVPVELHVVGEGILELLVDDYFLELGGDLVKEPVF